MPAEKTKKSPLKPITAKRLENAAFHYLGRFEASEQMLLTVMERKIRRWTGQSDISDHRDALSELVDKCRRLDLVNDARFAKMRANTFLRRGYAQQRIAQLLRAKGVSMDIIHETLNDLEPHEERRALVTIAKKKRIHVYRGPRQLSAFQADPHKQRNKEKAALARAGHGWNAIAAFFEITTQEDLEAWVSETD